MSHSLTSKKAAIALFAGIVAFAIAALAPEQEDCRSGHGRGEEDHRRSCSYPSC